MKETSWTDMAQLAGIVAIVASLIFVGLQLKQSEQLGYSEIVANMSDRKAALNELMTDHADLWHKACAGDELDAGSRIIAQRIFGAVMGDAVAEYIARNVGIASSESARQRIVERVAAQLWKNPGMKRMFYAGADWHQGTVTSGGAEGLTSGFSTGIAERLVELESNGKVPIFDSAWCGQGV
jgi:hypothetical protein